MDKREIKFKIWDVEEKRMSEAFDLTTPAIVFDTYPDTPGFKDYIPLQFAATRTERFDFLQFTGLLDKNGKEIFEGDILSIDGGGKTPFLAVVIFEDCGFRAKVSWIPRGELQPELRAYVGWQFCDTEVVGNLFEHPELLKEEKLSKNFAEI